LHFTLSKFRARLIVALGLLAAVLMTNCCPPLSMNGKIEKPEQPLATAKSNVAIAANAPASSSQASAVEAAGK